MKEVTQRFDRILSATRKIIETYENIPLPSAQSMTQACRELQEKAIGLHDSILSSPAILEDPTFSALLIKSLLPTLEEMVENIAHSLGVDPFENMAIAGNA